VRLRARLLIGTCLALLALAACGIKGEPTAPTPQDAQGE
jgi:predicted small lipoprotein YifL